MRFPAVAVPAILLLAGTVYFFAKAKENAGRSTGAQFAQTAPAPSEDWVADEYDREVVHTYLPAADLSEDQLNALVRAAGRRYMRRKMAYNAASLAVETGKSVPGGLDPLRRDMEAARKVCDVAESLGRRTQDLTAGWELERRFAYLPSSMAGLTERFDGSSTFNETDLVRMEVAFEKQFGKPLPVSARGDSAVHRAMGFDHRGRFDVAVSPSQPEGVWARHYLTEKHVTFFAFRSAVPGKATGAHIHIGPASIHRAPRS
jgi:hypothetical protein